MRDPRIDPAPGDVLCPEGGSACVIVDSAGDVVRYRILRPECPDEALQCPLAEWRVKAKRTVPLADCLATLQREHAEHTARAAKLADRIAWLRGAT